MFLITETMEASYSALQNVWENVLQVPENLSSFIFSEPGMILSKVSKQN